MKKIVLRIMLLFTTVSLLLTGLPAAFAAVVFYPTNGHYYEDVPVPHPNLLESWQFAENDAESRIYNGWRGHLATLTNQDENDWVWSAFFPEPFRYFLGGYQEPSAGEPDSDWQWITGEPWSFTNWDGGEPNNGSVAYDEDALSFAVIEGAPGKWNDLPNSHQVYHAYYVQGYIIEYEPSASSTPEQEPVLPEPVIPEPTTALLFSSGLLGFVLRKRKV